MAILPFEFGICRAARLCVICRQSAGRASRVNFLGRIFTRPFTNQFASPDDIIYVLGVGNLGKYVAHSIMKQAPGSVTLLFHRPDLEEQWQSAGSQIQCVTDGVPDATSGFGVEVLPPSEPPTADQAHQKLDQTPIKNLIVATKTYMTTSALERVKGRLGPESTVLFLQNGMGMFSHPLKWLFARLIPRIGTMDEASAKIFRDPSTRPAYWAGICSAGVYSTYPFTIVHAGRGPLLLGPVDARPSFHGQDLTSTFNPMAQRLSQASVLEATVLSYDAIKESQLQKLVVNAVINPLTAIFRCKNGQLLDNPARLTLMGLLIEEIGPIVRALLHDAPDMFSNQNLLEFVLTVARKTGANTSSMLQDVQAGRRTEIDYINGYVAAQGEALGLPYTRNSAVARLVKEQQIVRDDEVATRMFPSERLYEEGWLQ